MTVFPVVDVSPWQVVQTEPIGRDRKVWLRDPAMPDDLLTREHHWLFKPVVVPSNGTAQGEDWVEKIVSRLGALLGVQCADVELAQRNGEPGSISRNVVPDGWEMVLGSELMGTVVPGYQEGETNPPGRPGHSTEMIMRALGRCRAPSAAGEVRATAMFAGYLVLDAWVANQDRHDQNWAVLRSSESGELRLAASYDHASSLGFNLADDRRAALLQGDALRRWAERGRAHRFEHDRRAGKRAVPSLVDTAHRALDQAGAGSMWITRLRTVDTAAVEEVVENVPKLSAVARTFVVALLDLNRRRLLGER